MRVARNKRPEIGEDGQVIRAQSGSRAGLTLIFAALITFVYIGGSVGTQLVKQYFGQGATTDQAMVSALLLNIALILLIWRRTSVLSEEVDVYRQAEVRAQHLAITDPLTNLFNRRAIKEKTADLTARASRRGKSVAFMMIDLDGFKKINDLYGHDSGDQLLREVADRMRDTAPPSSILARLGGDEFGICMVFEPEFPETVDRVAEDLVEVLSRPITIGDTDHSITASIGIARPEMDCDGIDMLIRRADIALYAAKKNGRNGFCWFESGMEVELRTRNSLEADIRAAIPNEEFVPYFEQQIDLQTGELAGFEMLARWVSPMRGLIPPDEFIPVAEETGMIGDLSLSIIRKAMLEAKNWDPKLTISVNISPVQLKDPWLAQKIVKLLVETGFPANRLEVEITESSLFKNLSLAQSIVGSLKNQGIQIALDDFGTGYSSLAHLRALPFDRIKIDRSFVSTMLENSESAAIVNAIAGLGSSLCVPITAEGIEEQQLVDKLRELGCTKGQGWFYGQPLSVENVRQLLAERNLLISRKSSNLAEKQDVQAGLPYGSTGERAAG
ncbi:MAG: EAL domain-containing protein [Sphingomonadales bacterium]|jgi:diguanylate cyclase (GGDEF)-like protein|nr:EAL domain-containing protein [Sphingomonadales bacterium]MBK9003748.1 EAL domain-containing protein [Sphingomonadales bacterium]MBK9268922.1 EAL domain-containing protein [Sphingomonadales bacterium]MBP6434475.1 EAL domain-containing protein [Sphingorhabdus sp.]